MLVWAPCTGVFHFRIQEKMGHCDARTKLLDTELDCSLKTCRVRSVLTAPGWTLYTVTPVPGGKRKERFKAKIAHAVNDFTNMALQTARKNFCWLPTVCKKVQNKVTSLQNLNATMFDSFPSEKERFFSGVFSTFAITFPEKTLRLEYLS